jgi:hypothetical protein
MIVKSVVLRCDPERAFLLFTERAGQWWPADRRHTGDPASTIRIEATGRFYERASDGTECDIICIKKGLRGRFGMYVPPVLEALGLAEVEHNPKNNRIRAL